MTIERYVLMPRETKKLWSFGRFLRGLAGRNASGLRKVDSGGSHKVWDKGGFAVVEDGVKLFFYAAVACRDSLDERLEIAEVIELVVEQVRARDVCQGRQDRAADKRCLLFQLIYEPFNSRTLQIGLRAAEVAWDDRKLPLPGIFDDLFFLTIGKWANDRVIAGVVSQDWRHSF